MDWAALVCSFVLLVAKSQTGESVSTTTGPTSTQNWCNNGQTCPSNWTCNNTGNGALCHCTNCPLLNAVIGSSGHLPATTSTASATTSTGSTSTITTRYAPTTQTLTSVINARASGTGSRYKTPVSTNTITKLIAATATITTTTDSTATTPAPRAPIVKTGTTPAPNAVLATATLSTGNTRRHSQLFLQATTPTPTGSHLRKSTSYRSPGFSGRVTSLPPGHAAFGPVAMRNDENDSSLGMHHLVLWFIVVPIVTLLVSVLLLLIVLVFVYCVVKKTDGPRNLVKISPARDPLDF